MSATPVINNLYEAKALLEMTRGEKFDELRTFSTIANALAIQEKLMLYGIRRSSKLQERDRRHLKRSAFAFLLKNIQS
jgi:hypothetical protein